MYQEIATGIADIKHGGTDYDIQAALEFALAAAEIPVALNTCESMGDDITAIEQWAAIFKDPAALIKKLTVHYALHKAEIKADIASFENDWGTQLYFKAGQDLADLATVAIGPISETPTELPQIDNNTCGVTDLET